MTNTGRSWPTRNRSITRRVANTGGDVANLLPAITGRVAITGAPMVASAADVHPLRDVHPAATFTRSVTFTGGDVANLLPLNHTGRRRCLPNGAYTSTLLLRRQYVPNTLSKGVYQKKASTFHLLAGISRRRWWPVRLR